MINLVFCGFTGLPAPTDEGVEHTVTAFADKCFKD